LEISKSKLFFIIIGSAISGVIIFFLVFWVIAFFISSNSKNNTATIELPPALEKSSTEKYLGTDQIISGKFDSLSEKELAVGPGMIVGKAIVDGQPCSGLKLRLALNGKVWSQWAVTDNRGKYKIKVPFGEYRVDGWYLDEQSSDKSIPGKIHHPSGIFTMFESFIVDEQKLGKGPVFSFISPVRIIHPVGEVSFSEDLILEWEPYPNASYYKIQIRDYRDGHSFVGKRLYKASKNEPITRKTKVSFKEIGANLVTGHYYTVTIWALNEDMYQISRSLDNRGFGFSINH